MHTVSDALHHLPSRSAAVKFLRKTMNRQPCPIAHLVHVRDEPNVAEVQYRRQQAEYLRDVVVGDLETPERVARRLEVEAIVDTVDCVRATLH